MRKSWGKEQLLGSEAYRATSKVTMSSVVRKRATAPSYDARSTSKPSI